MELGGTELEGIERRAAWLEAHGVAGFAPGPASEVRARRLARARYERALVSVTEALARAGIPHLFAKGWALARLHPRGARRCGDIDVFVLATDVERARALGRATSPRIDVDVHGGFGYLTRAPMREVLRRGSRLPLGDAHIPVPAAEDHLHLVTEHALKHGLARAIWAVDVATLLEDAPDAARSLVARTAAGRATRWWRAAWAGCAELVGVSAPADLFDARDLRRGRWLAARTRARWSRHPAPGRPAALHLLRGGRPWHRRLAEIRDPVGAMARLGVPPVPALALASEAVDAARRAGRLAARRLRRS